MLGIHSVYPKIHHAGAENPATISALDVGFAPQWQEAGFNVVGWGWLEGDPVQEARLAVDICWRYGLDGYIANAEAPYEGEGNYWKSQAFVDEFTRLAPWAPLGLAYIGDGYPYRELDFAAWVNAGAALLPQCYWDGVATSIQPSIDAIDRLGVPHDIVFPILGTSAFKTPYPAEFYGVEVANLGQPYSVWLLESTTDDVLRAIAP